MKVLLYLASNSPFYQNLYPSIKKGFEEAGCEVHGDANLLAKKELIEKIKLFKPDFVFEMNRVKSEIENFPKGVIHICWLVDFWGRVHDELKGSDILYVWADEWVKHFQKIGMKEVYHLPPATDKTIYKPLKLKKRYDFIFLGHISKNWTDEELSRKIGFKDKKIVYFKDLLPYAKKYVTAKNNNVSFLDSLADENIILNNSIDKTIIYDISNRTYRQIRREYFIDVFTKTSDNIVIYGSENWKLYDGYSSYYKGYISKPNEINRAICESNILLHDGNYPHFRTFDAMASGVVVAAAQPPDNFDNPWRKLGFKDGEDYINVDIYSKKIDIKLFKDKNLLKKISQNAKEKVLKEHLWVHRAQRVLKDVSDLLKRNKDVKRQL